MKIVTTAPAQRDVARYVDFLRMNNRTAGDRFVAEYDALIQRLANRELEGAEAVMLNGRRVRAWSLPPMRILYTRREDTLVIVRVHHSLRRPITR